MTISMVVIIKTITMTLVNRTVKMASIIVQKMTMGVPLTLRREGGRGEGERGDGCWTGDSLLNSSPQ
jgi:hypothetical protein